MILAYFCFVLVLIRKSPPKIATPKILSLVGSCANLLVLTQGRVVLLVDLPPLCVALALFPRNFSCFSPILCFPLPDLSIQTTSDVRRITDVRQKRTSDVRNTTDVRNLAEDCSLVSLDNPSSVCDSHFGPTEPSLSSIAGSRNLGTLVLTKAKLRAHSSISNSASSKVVKSEIAIQKKASQKKSKRYIKAFKQTRAQQVSPTTNARVEFIPIELGWCPCANQAAEQSS